MACDGEQRDYRVFGLTLRAAEPLPELALAPQGSPVDVTLVIGDPRDARPGDFTLDLGRARLWVGEGRRIVLQPAAGVAAAETRLYALGTALGLICHQRGLLPLHANALAVDGLAFAVAGPSGAGKSTLAAMLSRLGCGFLSDDVCAVGFSPDGAPVTWPGVARIKLWPDALAGLGLEADGLVPVAPGLGKFSLPVTEVAAAAKFPLRRIYVLGDDLGAAPRRLRGAEAMGAVMANVYRREEAQAAGLGAGVFEAAARLVARCEIWRLPLFRDWQGFGAAAAALIEGVRGGAEVKPWAPL